MRTGLALLIAAFFAPALAWGQDARFPFRPGLLVTVAGDTLRGEVQDNLPQRLADEVWFRPAPDAQARAYRAGEASGFTTPQGAVYRSRVVPLSYEGEPAAVFLRVVVDGPASLLTAPGVRSAPVYFVESESQPAAGLFVVEGESGVSGGRSVREVQAVYRATLARAFVSCPLPARVLGATRLVERDLAAAVNGYNACSDPSYTPARPMRVAARTDVALRPGVRTGASRAQLLGPNGSSGGDVVPFIGLGLDVELLGVAPRVFLTSEVSFQRKGSFGDEEAASPFRPDNLDATYLNLHLGAAYQSPSRGPSPTFGAGMTFGRLVGDRDTRRVVVWNGDRRSSYKPPAGEAGLYAEAGVAYPLGRTTSLLKVRLERTALDSFLPFFFLATPGGAATEYRNQTATVTLGVRL